VLAGNSADIAFNPLDSDGTIQSVLLDITLSGTSVFSEVLIAPYTSTWNLENVADGDYVIGGTAKDNDGLDSALVTINVAVKKPDPVNQPPTVTITSPSDSDVLAGFSADIAVDATDSDQDGTVESIAITVTNGEGAEVFSEFLDTIPGVITWSLIGVSDGDYAIMAIATDNEGLDSDPVTTNVTVTNPDIDSDTFSNILEETCKSDPLDARSVPSNTDGDELCNELDSDPAYEWGQLFDHVIINEDIRNFKNSISVRATGSIECIKITFRRIRTVEILVTFEFCDNGENGDLVAGDNYFEGDFIFNIDPLELRGFRNVESGNESRVTTSADMEVGNSHSPLLSSRDAIDTKSVAMTSNTSGFDFFDTYVSTESFESNGTTGLGLASDTPAIRLILDSTTVITPWKLTEAGERSFKTTDEVSDGELDGFIGEITFYDAQGEEIILSRAQTETTPRVSIGVIAARNIVPITQRTDDIYTTTHVVNYIIPKTYSHQRLEDRESVTKAVCGLYSNMQFDFLLIENYFRVVKEPGFASAYFIGVSNTTEGIGRQIYSDFDEYTGEYRYGCPGLKSIGTMATTKSGVAVPHEIGHTYLMSFTDEALPLNNRNFTDSNISDLWHWGHSSLCTGLMSSGLCLTDTGGENLRSSVVTDKLYGQFNEWDLYSWGLISASEVNPQWFFTNPEASIWFDEDIPKDNPYLQLVTVNDLIATYGDRVPAVGQTSYQIGCIAISEEPMSEAEMAYETLKCKHWESSNPGYPPITPGSLEWTVHNKATFKSELP
jgi:hypothetical protein